MKSVKKLPGKRILKMPLGIGFSVLFISVMGLFASCDSPALNRPSNANSQVNGIYAIPEQFARSEVKRYDSFITRISRLKGIDLAHIPQYFTVSNNDFLAALGINKTQRESLQIQFTHSRLYISMGVDSTIHLLFTPVLNGAFLDLCGGGQLNLGKDTVLSGPFTVCPGDTARFGVPVPSSTGEKVLYDLNAPCPTTCLKLGSDSSFTNQK